MFGMKVLNSTGGIIIDSINPNYHLMEKLTLDATSCPTTYYEQGWWSGSIYSVDFTNDWWYDINFNQTYSIPPIIGFRSTATAGALVNFKRDGSNNYTGCYIMAQQDIGAVSAEIFIYSQAISLISNFGLVVRDSSNDIIFDSSRPLLNYIDNQDVTFSNNDSNRTMYVNGTRIDSFHSDGSSIQEVNITHADSGGLLPILILGFWGRAGYFNNVVDYIAFHKFVGIKNINSTTSQISLDCGGEKLGSGSSTYEEFNTYSWIYENNPAIQTIVIAKE